MNTFFNPKTLKRLRERLERAWDESTSFGRRRDVAKGRSEGQCYATSRVLHNIYGGRVMLGSVGAFHDHCWLEIEFSDVISKIEEMDGKEKRKIDVAESIKVILDMTADQKGIERGPIIWGLYEPHPNPEMRDDYCVYSDYKPRREVEDEEAARRLGGRAFKAYERLLQRLKETGTI